MPVAGDVAILVTIIFIQQVTNEIPLFNIEISDINITLIFDRDGF